MYGLSLVDKKFKVDPKNEGMRTSITQLISEMDSSGLDSVPTIETTANKNILSGEGWFRLNKIIRERKLKRGLDIKLTLIEIKQLLDSSK